MNDHSLFTYKVILRALKVTYTYQTTGPMITRGVLVLSKFCKIVVRQVFGRMCSMVFYAFTLKLPIQTLLSVVPTHSLFWRTKQFQQNEHTQLFHAELKKYPLTMNGRVFLPAVHYPATWWIALLPLKQVASRDKKYLLHRSIAWLLKFLKCGAKKV